MRILLLVESNTTGTGRHFAQRAAALGAEPVLLCADPGRYPYAEQDGIRQVVTDTSDDAAVLATARTLGNHGQVTGVLSSSEYYVACAAATASSLGLPGPDADAIRACRNKGVQRAGLRRAGIASPDHAVAGSAAEVARSGLTFPVVVKPVQGSGSVGVRWCADPEQASAHAAELLAATANERGLPVPAQVLVEEYVAGPEYSVEVFAGQPVVVVFKHTGALPQFVETGHDLPALLPPGAEKPIAAVAAAAVRALRLDWGAVHVEVRAGRDGPRIVEVNPRPAGGMIPELVRHALGVDLIDAQIRVACGRDPGVRRRTARFASIRFLTAPEDSIIAEPARATASARAVPGVVDAVLSSRAGTRVEPATDFRGRVGHVIAVAEGAHDAVDAAEQGLKLLSEALQPVGPDGVR